MGTLWNEDTSKQHLSTLASSLSLESGLRQLLHARLLVDIKCDHVVAKSRMLEGFRDVAGVAHLLPSR